MVLNGRGLSRLSRKLECVLKIEFVLFSSTKAGSRVKRETINNIMNPCEGLGMLAPHHNSPLRLTLSTVGSRGAGEG